MNKPLWQPSVQKIKESQLEDFSRFINFKSQNKSKS